MTSEPPAPTRVWSAITARAWAASSSRAVRATGSKPGRRARAESPDSPQDHRSHDAHERCGVERRARRHLDVPPRLKPREVGDGAARIVEALRVVSEAPCHLRIQLEVNPQG